jgi:hypothetical protein
MTTNDANKVELPSSIARNSIDKSWISLLHNLYSSKVLLDSSAYSLHKDSNLLNYNSRATCSLQVFSNSSSNNYLHKLDNSNFTFNITSRSLLKSSTIMQNVTFTTPLNLSTLNSASSTLSASYTSSIEENLSLANQSR